MPGDEQPQEGGGKVYNWPGRTADYQRRRAAEAQRKAGIRAAFRRPGWWSPEGLIERLRDGWGVVAVVNEASKSAGQRIKPRALHSDIKEWKKDPEFKADYEAALALRTGTARSEISTDWFEDFYQALKECEGVIEHACDMAGVGIGIVHALRNPDNKKHYNREFAERVSVLEGARLGRIEQSYLAQADKKKGDPRVQERVLQARVPERFNPKQVLRVEGKVTVEHRLEREVVNFAAARSSALFGNRRAELPAADEPAVIDVTPAVVAEKLEVEP